MEKSADFRSKSWNYNELRASSSGDAIPMTNLILASFSSIRSFDIHDHNICALATAHPDTCPNIRKPLNCEARGAPLVVCWRLVSSMTSNVVPNSLLSSVPTRVSQHWERI